MPDAYEAESRKNTLVGREPSTSAVIKIDYDGVISSLDELIQPPEVDHFVTPGLIDLQVNGFAGVDYNDPSSSAESIANSIRALFATGVTRFFPTIITTSRERFVESLSNLARVKEEFQRNNLPEAQAIAGFHVEGPHISPEDGPRGAHPSEHIRPPDVDEFKHWQDAAEGNVRLITVSPEWEQTPFYISEIVRAGVVASIGHTKATPHQIEAATSAGATMSTHLGNAAQPTLPKTQNYIWDQLAEDRLTASFIADGIHIPAAFLQSAIRAKGVDKSVLVTDAVMPATCDPGFYRLGTVDVELHADGSVTLRGGTRLAGSGLRMDRAIGNTVRMAKVSLTQALAMATVNAARVARVAGRQRSLTPGEKADFVKFQWNDATQAFTVVETIVAGISVYKS